MSYSDRSSPEFAPVKIAPIIDNRLRLQKPTLIVKGDEHNLNKINESKTGQSIKDKLLSFYKTTLRQATREDITYEDEESRVIYVVHINIDRMMTLLSKPAKKLRANQKRVFYGVSPWGHTVLHCLAKIVAKNDHENPVLDDAFMRIMDWKFMDPSIVDNTQRNVFNYLIGGSEHVRPNVLKMYNILLDKDIYPNPTPKTKEATLKQNFFRLWNIYYPIISFSSVDKYVLQNMNEDVDSNMTTIVEKTTFRDYEYSEIESFLINVNTFCPIYLHRFYRKLMSSVSCEGCANLRLMRFHSVIAATIHPEIYRNMLLLCDMSFDYFILQRMNYGRDKSIFQTAVIRGNWKLVEFILSRIIDTGGITYDCYDKFVVQIKSVAHILVNKRMLDIIMMIVHLTSESIISEYLSQLFKNTQPKIDATEGKEFICSTCWCEFDTTDPGYVFPSCGHFPFCSTCFDNMEFCPFCYESSESGKIHDMMAAIMHYKDSKYELDKIKLYDVSHSFDEDEPAYSFITADEEALPAKVPAITTTEIETR